MTDNLKYNLYSKCPLRFANGKFKVLMLSDLQETLETGERTVHDMDALIERVKPDFVVLGGDNCDVSVNTAEKLKEYLDVFTRPMESRNIPWMHIFGNHDHDLPIERDAIIGLYESYPHCVSKHLDASVHGVTNYTVPVCDKDGTPRFMLWSLDTNRCAQDDHVSRGYKISEYVRPKVSSVFDAPRFDQIMWYYNSSVELERHFGNPVYGMIFMHVAPWEAQLVVDNKELCHTQGSTDETMWLGQFNTGVFAATLERNDIVAFASGHSHKDTFDGELFGIKICLDGSAGYRPYGIEELRGGRVFEIDEAHPEKPETYMVFYKDN